MSSSGIEQRLRLLSAEKRSLLARRLQHGVDTMTDAADLNGTRLTAFLTTKPLAADSLDADAGELRRYLSKLLPEYMIPASFRLLHSMPLLPNGKVDLTALREMPEKVFDACDTWVEPRNATEHLLADIWCEVLQMDSVSVHDNFFELGGDSILSIHVVSKVNQQGLSLSPSDLFNFPTIAQLEARITSMAARSGQTTPKFDTDKGMSSSLNSTEQQTDDGTPSVLAEGVRYPFIMVHAVSEMVSVLRSHLDLDRPVYALTAAIHWEQADIERQATVEELAEKDLAELRSLQPVGPYFLGGYSMGAPIAAELAYRLQLAGEKVELLFLLDPPGRPVTRSSSQRPPLVSSRNVARHLGKISGLSLAAKLKYVLVKARQTAKHHLLNRPRVFTRRRVIRPAATVLAMLYRRFGLEVPTPLKNHYVGSIYTDAWNRYKFKPYHGRVVLFYASKTPQDRQDWEGVTRGELTAEAFEGGHYDFVRNPQLMTRWMSRLAQLLETYKSIEHNGGSKGSAP